MCGPSCVNYFLQRAELCVQAGLLFDPLKHVVTELWEDLMYLNVHSGDGGLLFFG